MCHALGCRCQCHQLGRPAGYELCAAGDTTLGESTKPHRVLPTCGAAGGAGGSDSGLGEFCERPRTAVSTTVCDKRILV